MASSIFGRCCCLFRRRLLCFVIFRWILMKFRIFVSEFSRDQKRMYAESEGMSKFAVSSPSPAASLTPVISTAPGSVLRTRRACRSCPGRATPCARRASSPILGLTQLSNYLTLNGSFSAVSKPNFARKYALESSRRDPQNELLCSVL